MGNYGLFFPFSALCARVRGGMKKVWIVAGVALIVGLISANIKYGGEFTLVILNVEDEDHVGAVEAFSQKNIMSLPSELRRHLCGPPFLAPAVDADNPGLPGGVGIALLLCGPLSTTVDTKERWLEKPKDVFEKALGRRISTLSYTTFADDHGCRTPNAKLSLAIGQWLDIFGLRPPWNLALHVYNTG